MLIQDTHDPCLATAEMRNADHNPGIQIKGLSTHEQASCGGNVGNQNVDGRLIVAAKRRICLD